MSRKNTRKKNRRNKVNDRLGFGRNRGAGKQRRLHVEDLEARRVLAVTGASFVAPSPTSSIEGTQMPGDGPFLAVDYDGTAGSNDVFFTSPALTGPTADAADFSNGTGLETLKLDFGALGAGTYTIDLSDPNGVLGSSLGITHTGGMELANDSLVEGSEFVSLQVNGAPSTVGGGFTNTRHEIIDNESASILLSDSVNEGGGTQSFDVILNLTGDGSPSLADTYTGTIDDNVGGDLASSSDYATFLPQTIQFLAGAVDGDTNSFSLTPQQDVLVEGTEDIAFSLIGSTAFPTDYIADTTGTVNILDDEMATVTFVDLTTGADVSMSMADEFDPGGDTKFNARLNLSGVGTGVPVLAMPLSFKVTIDNTSPDVAEYASIVGPPTNGDYIITAPSGGAFGPADNMEVFTFATGSADGAVTLFDVDHEAGFYDDEILEGDEVVRFTLDTIEMNGMSLAGANTDLFELIIKDNEMGTISIARDETSELEGDAATPTLGLNDANFTITVTPTPSTVSLASDFALSVPVSIVGGGGAVDASSAAGGPVGTGTGGADFDSSGLGTVFVGPSGSASLAVPIWADLALEGTESITATISSVQNPITIGTASQTIDIVDDDSASLVIVSSGDSTTRESQPSSFGLDPDDGTFSPANDIFIDDADFWVELQSTNVGFGGASVVADSATVAQLQLDASSTTNPNTGSGPTDFVIFSGLSSADPGQVTVPAGSHRTLVEVVAIDDNTVETAEQGVYEFEDSLPGGDPIILSDPDVAADTSSSFTFDVIDNDSAEIRLRVSDPTAAEAPTPNDLGLYVFELVDGAGNLVKTSQPLTVTYSFLGLLGPNADDPGFSGDFAFLDANGISLTSTGTITLPANASSVSILVQPINDNLAEPTETVDLEFTSFGATPLAITPAPVSGSNTGVIGGLTGVGHVNILDDEGPQTVSMTTSDSLAEEDGFSAASRRVRVELSIPNPSSAPTTGQFTITNTDVSPSDYSLSGLAPEIVSLGGGLFGYTFDPSQTSFTFDIVAVDDNIIEDNETITVDLLTATNPVVTTTVDASDNQVVATIRDNRDEGLIFTRGIVNTAESASGSPFPGSSVGRIDFELATSGNNGADEVGTSDTSTIFTFTLGGVATVGDDYDVFTSSGASYIPLSPSGGVYSLTIPAGDRSTSIFVVGKQDSFLEGAESVIATLGSVSSGDVDIDTASNVVTATPPFASHTASTGGSVIAACDLPTGAGCGGFGGTATVFITDDDTANVRVTATDDVATEDNSGPSTDKAEFTFELVDSAGNPFPVADVMTDITISYSVTPVSGGVFGVNGAIQGTDYMTLPGTIDIAAGSNASTLDVMALNDLIAEGPEYFELSLQGVSVIGLTGVGIDNSPRPGASSTDGPLFDADIVQIADDDQGEAFITTSSDSINFPTNAIEESGQMASFFVNLTNPAVIGQTVRISVGGTTGTPMFGTADAETNIAGNAAGIADLDLMGGVIDPSTGLATGFAVEPTASTPSLTPTLAFVGIDSVTGRELYDITFAPGATVAHIQVYAVDDMIVEGTENIDIDLEPSQPGLNSSFFTPSATFNAETLTIEESDTVRIIYESYLTGSGNSTTEVTLDPEGTGSPPASTSVPGDTDVVTITVDRQVEGVLEIAYDQNNVSTINGDYSVTFNTGGSQSPPPGSANTVGGQGYFILTNNPAGWSSTIPVASVPDADIEVNETFQLVTVDAVHNNAGLIDTMDRGVVEIADDDVISVSVESPVSEGDAGDPDATSTVTISVASGTLAGVLQYYTQDGTAVSGSLPQGGFDYDPIASTMAYWDGNNFRSGSATGPIIGPTLSFDVNINGDDVIEGDQSFDVVVERVSGLSLPFTDLTTPVTIDDDDIVTINISGTFNETAGASGTTTGTAAQPIVTLNKAVEGTLEFDLDTASGMGFVGHQGATSDGNGNAAPIQDDYLASSVNNVQFMNSAAGAMMTPLSVDIHRDSLVEPTESVNVLITNVSHTGSSATVPNYWTAPHSVGSTLADEFFIQDDDTASFAVGGTGVTEGGTANVPVAVALPVGHTLQYATSFVLSSTNGGGVGGAFDSNMPGIQPAPQPADYDGTSVTVSVPAGSGTGPVTGAIVTNDDTIIEATEAFSVTGGSIASPTSIGLPNFSIGGTGTVTITDNDSGFIKVSGTDGTEGGPDGTFTFTIEDGSGNPLITDVDTTVEFFISNDGDVGAALLPADYDIVAPSLAGPPVTYLATINAGQSSATIIVDVEDDSLTASDPTEDLVEPVETTVDTVSFTGPSRNITHIMMGTPASGTIDIIDNDTPPPTVVSSITVGNAGWVIPQQEIFVTTPTETLPWVNIDQVTVSYSGSAPTLTLSNGDTPTLLSDDGSTAVFSITTLDIEAGLTFDASGAMATVDVLPGDVFFDAGNVVGSPDVVTALGAFGSTTDLRSDVNGDGVTGSPDIVEVLGRFGTNIPLPISVGIDTAFEDEAETRVARRERIADLVFAGF